MEDFYYPVRNNQDINVKEQQLKMHLMLLCWSWILKRFLDIFVKWEQIKVLHIPQALLSIIPDLKLNFEWVETKNAKQW